MFHSFELIFVCGMGAVKVQLHSVPCGYAREFLFEPSLFILAVVVKAILIRAIL